MIKTTGLIKEYGKLKAVDGLNLNIEKGLFYGLLGPNGAGKTTTIKMLSMLLTPTEGEIYIDGNMAKRTSKGIKQIIGVVPQHLSLQKETTVYETLALHGYLHKMKRAEIKNRIAELLEFAEMSSMLKMKIETLSGGNKRKLMILRAMMHYPKVLFLDEPTVGLDPSIRRVIWDLLKKLQTKGLTIILTTHYIEEAKTLCDILGMMSKGKVIQEASPSKYMEEVKPYVLEQFDGEKTNYSFFKSRDEASTVGASLDGEVSIRKSNLEDVYVKYTNDRRFS